jgi:hypothetical protein
MAGTCRLWFLKTYPMQITNTIKHIRGKLLHTFGIIDSWFDADAALLHFSPGQGRWSIAQVLEHISLTNYYLLLLIEKGTTKAIKAKEKQDLAAALNGYHFRRVELEQVSIPDAFTWVRPEHMEPAGTDPQHTVRLRLKQQVNQCMTCLGRLDDGAGVLYKTIMTVNALGKLDVYEYIYFLVMHGLRHIDQIEKNAVLFRQANG